MQDRRVEERVARLEGRTEGIDGRFDAIYRRFDAIDRRFDAVEGRIDALDRRLTGRIDALDQRVARQLVWLVGIQITVLLAVVGALLAPGEQSSNGDCFSPTLTDPSIACIVA